MELAGFAYNRLLNLFSHFDERFYDDIIQNMLTYSFNCNTDIVEHLKKALPLFVDRLSEHFESKHSVLSMKIVDEVCKEIGYFNILGAKRKDESRLFFESALVLILYFGIRKQIFPTLATMQFYENYRELRDVYDESIPGFEISQKLHLNFMEQSKLVYFANFTKTTLLFFHNPK